MSHSYDQQQAQHVGLDRNTRPNEYQIDQHWDHCIDLTLRRVTYGAMFAGLGSLILLSELLTSVSALPFAVYTQVPHCFTQRVGGNGFRAATTGIGAGFGAGSAWTDCKREVSHSCSKCT